MTLDQFIKWLDMEIEQNKKAIASSKGGDALYFKGWLESSTLIRAMFQKVDVDSQPNDKIDFAEGLT